ncbi:MAG: hypothetical protein JXA94_01610 [Parachlamydiales bacterium]|nr:hypothetical protein [Parachlamydiales bacterium]
MPKEPTDPIGKAGPGKIPPDKISETGTSTPPDRASFESYKQAAPGAPGAAETTGSEISPMELASKSTISSTPTFQTLAAQARNAQDTLGEIQKNLNTPNLNLKKSQQDLLGTKLSNANDHLKAANQTIGANVPEDTQVDKSANPIVKFLGMVTDGQNKIFEVQNKLKEISNDAGKNLRPADMLLIQVKLSQAQQEIEFSSVLLGKTVDSLKTLLQIQL